MFKSITPETVDDLWPSAQPETNAARKSTLLAMAASAYAVWAEARATRRAERELYDLDNRMLKDIGINRTQIGSVVRYGRGF